LLSFRDQVKARIDQQYEELPRRPFRLQRKRGKRTSQFCKVRKMEYIKLSLATVLVLLSSASPIWAAASIADGSWTDPNTWAGGGIPDQAANGGNGEDVFVSSDITVPSGVDFVSTTTIDASGNPAQNVPMFFDTASALGSSLTIQNGARVGSKFWTQVTGGATATVNVESGGEFVTAGINNSANTSFIVNVAQGGVLTFDASIHPPFPDAGFYRGNIFAPDGASNTFNISGRLDVANMSNSNAVSGTGTNAYNLLNGGVINEVPMAGQSIGVNSPGSALPDGSIDYDAITVTGSGRVINAFGGAGITNVPAGLTVDIADQTVFDTDFTGGWSDWITNGGGNPATMPGPRRAPIGGGDTDMFTGFGAIQFDIYGFEVNDQGTPSDPGDDMLGSTFSDQLYNGPGDPSESTFDGTFEIGYVGPQISDDLVALVENANPWVLLINGATNNSFFDNLEGLSVPDQVWSDGTRQFDVTFSDAFFGELGPPFPPGTVDSRLVFTSIESITPRSGGLAGDYNNDGSVDAADYVVWRKTGAIPDGYTTWRSNFGRTGPVILGNAAAAVPEPSCICALLTALAISGLFGRWHRGPRLDGSAHLPNKAH
jgi:hypothetical protein